MNGHVKARVTDWIGKDFNSSQRDIPAGQQVWVEDGALATHGDIVRMLGDRPLRQFLEIVILDKGSAHQL